MAFDGIGLLLGQSDRHGHLRHDRRAAPAYLTLVEQQHRGARARRRDGRVHAGAAGADDENVRAYLRHGRFMIVTGVRARGSNQVIFPERTRSRTTLTSLLSRLL